MQEQGLGGGARRPSDESLRRRAAAFVAACRGAEAEARGPLVVRLCDRGEVSCALRAAEVAQIMGRAETWVRVQTHFASFAPDGGVVRGTHVLSVIQQRALDTSESR